MRSSFIQSILFVLTACLISFTFCNHAFAQDNEQIKIENNINNDNSAPVEYDTKNMLSIHAGFGTAYLADIRIEYLHEFAKHWRTGFYLLTPAPFFKEHHGIFWINEIPAVKVNSFEFVPRVGIGLVQSQTKYGGDDSILDRLLLGFNAGLGFYWRLNKIISLGFIIDTTVSLCIDYPNKNQYDHYTEAYEMGDIDHHIEKGELSSLDVSALFTLRFNF